MTNCFVGSYAFIVFNSEFLILIMVCLKKKVLRIVALITSNILFEASLPGSTQVSTLLVNKC